MQKIYFYTIIFLLSILFVTINAVNYDEVKNSRNFTGKEVLVTGLSSGIGEETVKLFSSLGASVVITGRNKTNIKRVAEESHKLSPRGLKISDDRVHLINATINEFGRIDVLVNNAGALYITFINDSDILSKFDNSFKVDTRAALNLIHLSLPFLKKSKATIINISAISASHPIVGSAGVAKASLEMLTKVLAIELGRYGIRVNAIAPGYIETINISLFPEAQIKRFVSTIPLQRTGNPIDIANGIVFLASNDAEYITGTVLIIDGGVHYNIGATILSSWHKTLLSF